MLPENQLHSFFYTYPLPSLQLNVDNQFTIAKINSAYSDYRDQLDKKVNIDPVGKSFFQLVPDNVDRLHCVLNQVLDSKESVKSELVIENAGSEVPDVDTTLNCTAVFSPVFNEQGDIDCIICSLIIDNSPAADEDTLTTDSDSNQKNEREKDRLLLTLQERIKEQSCLYKICNLNEQELTIDELLNKAVHILPEGWQFTEFVESAIIYDGEQYTTQGYRANESEISAETEISPGSELAVKVHYREGRQLHDSTPFVKQEQYLVDAIHNHLSLKLEQKLSQNDLKEKQKMLDKAYQLARIGTWEFDMKTQELHWSDVTKEVHGFGSDYNPDLESTINLFKEGHNRDTFARAARDAIDHEKPFDVELKIVSGQGDERWIRATGEPEYKDGVCTRFYGISQDVTDRRKAEEDLMLSERRFRSLVQDGSDLMAILDENANYKYVSPTSEPILGIPAEDFIGNNAIDYIHPEDQDRITEIISKLEPGSQLNISPFRFRNADGDWRWVETTLTNMMEDPAVGGLVTNSRDVTEHKKQEQKLLEALKEKETLLAEIHHRVKNNLAVVSGMMQLQLTEEEDEELTEKLHDSIIRIKTMANIHEQLYQSNSFSQLNFTENIESLVLNIQTTLQSDTKIHIDFNCEPIHLNINQAIPCSLIVNEVVTNIFKHAFPKKGKGHIRIELSESTKNSQLYLAVEDDGVGLPTDFDISESDSLGMNLIKVLSHQLNGNYSYESKEAGTAFTIQFEKDSLKGIGNSLF